MQRRPQDRSKLLAFLLSFLYLGIKHFFHPDAYLWCKADDVGRAEGGDDAHRYDHRIEKLTGDAQFLTQSSYDEGELTYLHHREAAADSYLHIAARHEVAQAAEEHLTQHDSQRQHKNRKPVLHQYRRFYHHADRHKEDGPEEVAQGAYTLFDVLCLERLCQNAAHHKGTEGRTVSHLSG